MAKQTKAKNSPKASQKAQTTKKADDIQHIEVEEVVTYKKEYWAKQVRLNGRVVTGEVIDSDKQEFLASCKKNGVKIEYDNWFASTDWRDRVFKKKGEKKIKR